MSELRASQYIYFLLARKDYTLNMLRQKAIAKGYSAHDINEVLSQLVDNSMVNDERLGRSIVESYAGKKGSIWLRAKMMQKQFTQEVIDEVLTDFGNNANDEFLSIVRKKYHIEKGCALDIKTKQQVINYIARQGFPNAIEIYKQLIN